MLLLVGNAFAFRARTNDLVSCTSLHQKHNFLIVQRISEHTFGFVPEIVKGADTKVFGDYTLDVLRRRISDYAPVVTTTDVSYLTDSERRVLQLLIEAAEYLNPIFNRQSFRWYEETREQLKRDGSDLAKAQLDFFDIMRGPWDRQEDEKPFVV